HCHPQYNSSEPLIDQETTWQLDLLKLLATLAHLPLTVVQTFRRWLFNTAYITARVGWRRRATTVGTAITGCATALLDNLVKWQIHHVITAFAIHQNFTGVAKHTLHGFKVQTVTGYAWCLRVLS